LRFAELQALSDHPKATLYRLVQTLMREGLLTRDGTGAYAPGLRLMRLAHSAWARSSLVQVARPHLDRLSVDLGQTVHLAQLDAGQVLYIDKRKAARRVEMFSDTGKIGPAYCTGVGKVLLAHLPADALAAVLPQQSFHRFTPQTLDGPEALLRELQAIRAAGAGFDREEHEIGIACVSVPVLARSGRCLAALSVTGTEGRSGLAALERLLPRLRTAATAIADDVAAWDFPEPAAGQAPPRGGRPDGSDG
jgi:DNA-binding IclR family transcriptional regulator